MSDVALRKRSHSESEDTGGASPDALAAADGVPVSPIRLLDLCRQKMAAHSSGRRSTSLLKYVQLSLTARQLQHACTASVTCPPVVVVDSPAPVLSMQIDDLPEQFWDCLDFLIGAGHSAPSVGVSLGMDVDSSSNQPAPETLVAATPTESTQGLDATAVSRVSDCEPLAQVVSDAAPVPLSAAFNAQVMSPLDVTFGSCFGGLDPMMGYSLLDVVMQEEFQVSSARVVSGSCLDVTNCSTVRPSPHTAVYSGAGTPVLALDGSAAVSLSSWSSPGSQGLSPILQRLCDAPSDWLMDIDPRVLVNSTMDTSDMFTDIDTSGMMESTDRGVGTITDEPFLSFIAGPFTSWSPMYVDTARCSADAMDALLSSTVV